MQDKKPILEYVVIFWLCLAMVGLTFSVFVLGMAMFGLLFTAIAVLIRQPERLGEFRRPGRHLPLLMLILLFLLVLPGGPCPEDPGYWWSRLRIKLPFLVLPTVFVLLPALTEANRRMVFRFAGLLLGLTTLVLTIYYIIHWPELSEAMKQGRPLPVPQNHIRFSLLLVIVALALLLDGLASRSRLWLLPAVWLMIFLHILAVRSGLMALYLSLGFLLLRMVFSSGKILPGLSGLLLMVILPLLAWRFLPSVQAKVGYMLYDIDQFRKGEVNLYADSGRLASWQVGWEIFREQPWTGTGIGYLRAAVAKKYALLYPEVAVPLMPHNQYISVLAGTGVFGLLIFLLALLYPFRFRGYRRDPRFAVVMIVFLSSFLVENTLENALGVGMFLFSFQLSVAAYSIRRKK